MRTLLTSLLSSLPFRRKALPFDSNDLDDSLHRQLIEALSVIDSHIPDMADSLSSGYMSKHVHFEDSDLLYAYLETDADFLTPCIVACVTRKGSWLDTELGTWSDVLLALYSSNPDLKISTPEMKGLLPYSRETHTYTDRDTKTGMLIRKPSDMITWRLTCENLPKMGARLRDLA